MDDTVEIKATDMSRGSSMGLRTGDIVTWRDLLFGMLLSSGNDAANAVARVIGSELLIEEGREGNARHRFVVEMNKLAKNLDLTGTNFRGPHGKDMVGQYSTALDLALLAKSAFSVPLIRHAAGKKLYRMRFHGSNPRTVEIATTNKMLGADGVIAGKTGSTLEAGACLALLSQRNGRCIVTVVLGSAVSFEKGRVNPASDRRYADIRAAMALANAVAGW